MLVKTNEQKWSAIPTILRMLLNSNSSQITKVIVLRILSTSSPNVANVSKNVYIYVNHFFQQFHKFNYRNPHCRYDQGMQHHQVMSMRKWHPCTKARSRLPLNWYSSNDPITLLCHTCCFLREGLYSHSWWNDCFSKHWLVKPGISTFHMEAIISILRISIINKIIYCFI